MTSYIKVYERRYTMTYEVYVVYVRHPILHFVVVTTKRAETTFPNEILQMRLIHLTYPAFLSNMPRTKFRIKA